MIFSKKRGSRFENRYAEDGLRGRWRARFVDAAQPPDDGHRGLYKCRFISLKRTTYTVNTDQHCVKKRHAMKSASRSLIDSPGSFGRGGSAEGLGRGGSNADGPGKPTDEVSNDLLPSLKFVKACCHHGLLVTGLLPSLSSTTATVVQKAATRQATTMKKSANGSASSLYHNG